MSKNHNNNWTIGRLRRRGWTNELIDQLLPKGREKKTKTGTTLVWNRHIVREMEETEEFLASSIGETLTDRTRKSAQRAASKIEEFLRESWQTEGESLTVRLAAYYCSPN